MINIEDYLDELLKFLDDKKPQLNNTKVFIISQKKVL